jgi:serine/threonine-protein kinase
VVIADTENHRVLRVSADGKTIKRVAGTGKAGANLIEGNPTGSELNIPCGVAVTPDGGVVIADTENHRVLRVSADGKTRTVVISGTDASGKKVSSTAVYNKQ